MHTTLRSVSSIKPSYERFRRTRFRDQPTCDGMCASAGALEDEELNRLHTECRPADILWSSAVSLTLVSDPASRLDGLFANRRIPAALPRRHPDINVVIAQTTPNRVDAAKVLTIGSPVRGHFVITQLLRSRPDHGMTEPHSRADAYVACVHLDQFDDYDVWCNNRHNSSRPLGAGTIHINDMRQEWRSDIRSPFHVMNFYIPQAALDELSNEQDVAQIEELRCPMSLGTH